MTQKIFDIHLIGVGGQGIGLLSEVILRAVDASGQVVRGVDTHGLAQRGGTVVSQIRIGNGAHSPLVRPHQAHLVVALERTEALRGMNSHLADHGALIYYDCEYQPLSVRMGKAKSVDPEIISQECHSRGIRVFKVYEKTLPDPRMQNVAVLAHIARNNLLPEVQATHFEKALQDLMSGTTLEKNLELFGRLTRG